MLHHPSHLPRGSITILSTVLVLLAASARADDPALHQMRQTRPIELGVSGGSAVDRDGRFCCGGTLGGLVEDCNGTQYVLSNNHVLGRGNRASVGEQTLQPALIDSRCSGDSDDAVAEFTELITIDFDDPNLVDAAIAQIRPATVDPTGAVRDIGVPDSQTASAVVGMSVQKSGRTTGHTLGTVVAIDVSVLVSYPKKCGGNGGPGALMTEQFRISDGSFSAGGDSGSVIFDTSAPPRAVGLLFAGSSTSTVANSIDNVLGAPWAVGPLAMAGAVPAGCSGCTADADCDDGDACTTDACGAGGQCSNDPIACDDGDACTADTCVGGACESAAVDCGDGDACTVDTCDTATGCVNVPDPECADPCGDGVCDIGSGETCRTCPDDCAGVTRGRPSGRFCCGEDTDCSDVRCGSGGSCQQGAIASADQSHGRTIAAAKAVKGRHSDRLLGLPDVVGHGVGTDAAGNAVIEVYLASEGVAGVPGKLEGIPVRRIVTGRFEAYRHR